MNESGCFLDIIILALVFVAAGSHKTPIELWCGAIALCLIIVRVGMAIQKLRRRK